MKFRFNLFFYIIFPLIFSCHSEQLPPIVKEPAFNKMDEGGITYTITYPPQESESFMMSLMPDKLDYRFKGNWTSTHLVAGQGAAELTFLSNSAEQKLITLVKFGTKKLHYVQQGESTIFNLLDFQGYELINSKDSVQFMGYNCKKIQMVSIANPLENYEIIYTEEINIPNPNWCSLFKNTNGVLLKFSALFNGMIINLVAKEIYNATLPSVIFQIPADYEASSKEEIKNLIPVF